jgi:glycosyltransferase involved in cell wall biosynthesis
VPEVAVIIPVLNRPQRIVECARNLHVVTPKAKIFIVADHRIYRQQEMMGALDHVNFLYPDVDIVVIHDPHPECGNYAKKINKTLQYVDAHYIFTGADDLHWHPNWLSMAEEAMLRGVGVIGTNDLGHPRVYAMHETSTHSLVRRSYIEEFGTIDEPGKVLHEGYVHEFVDDELVGTAKYRNAWAFAHGSLVEHMHPIWGKATWDATYEDQGRRMNESRALYAERCKLWGGQPI